LLSHADDGLSVPTACPPKAGRSERRPGPR
jgi:hypothetical protein